MRNRQSPTISGKGGRQWHRSCLADSKWHRQTARAFPLVVRVRVETGEPREPRIPVAPRPPLDPDVSAERLLRGALEELQEAEQILSELEANAPDRARATRLAIIRDAITQLRKVVSPRAD